jgi:uncharacterized protein
MHRIAFGPGAGQRILKLPTVQAHSLFIKNSAKRETLGMPKLHVVDTGLAFHLLGIKAEAQLIVSSCYATMVENLVRMECFKQLAWSNQFAVVMHFRDMKMNEVDIVFEMNNAELTAVK